MFTTLHNIEVTCRAGAVAAAPVLQADVMFQCRIQYRIAWGGEDGKAVRQKCQSDGGSIESRSLVHSPIVPVVPDQGRTVILVR